MTKMKKHNEYALLGLKALERAAAKVAENARKITIKFLYGKMGVLNMKFRE